MAPANAFLKQHSHTTVHTPPAVKVEIVIGRMGVGDYSPYRWMDMPLLFDAAFWLLPLPVPTTNA